ncbi:hypothetical protein pb186bvf_019139 [Paramecium bursaria]
MLNTEFGIHCEYQYCKQRDFLPFKCGECKHTYCIDHRSQTSHECKIEKVKWEAIVCPLCSESIKYQSDMDSNIVWEEHLYSKCTQQQKEKKKCAKPKCNQILTELNKNECKNCQKVLCLKHRFPEDHDCKPKWQMEKQITQQKQPVNQTGNEECPICGQKFPYIMQLINHSQIHVN